MGHLIAIMFDSREEAEETRKVLGRDENRPVNLAQTLIVFRDGKGRVILDRRSRHLGMGLLIGGMLGAFLGWAMPSSSILAGVSMSMFTCAVGAVFGMIGAIFIPSIPEAMTVIEDPTMINALDPSVVQEKAMLVLLVENEAIGAVIEDLTDRRGDLVKTSFDPKTEERIRTALNRHDSGT